ncbi:MAG: ABC transporter ATP-binding protein [Propionicimonas sp.]
MSKSERGLPVVLESVTKRYLLGDGSALVAAREVSFEVTAGQSVALTGTSGSGKSTLLHLIGAVDSPDSGTIRVGNVTVSGLRARSAADYRSTIGFVFQQYYLLPSLSLVDNVSAPLMGRRRVRDVRGKALELLASVGMADRADALPSQLSGGQQQRVAIARALIGDPGLLLADEPTGNLDSETAEDIMAMLEGLQSRFGVTVVVATHDADLAAWCDRRLSVRDGRVTEGAAEQHSPVHAPARAQDGVVGS